MAPTRSTAPGKAANRAANSSSGCTPGLMVTIVQAALPGRAPRRKAGTKPARTTEDLPLPDGPITARKRLARSPSTSHWVRALASEEEVGVLFVEGLQAAVGANLLCRRLNRTRCTRRDAADAARQSVEDVGVVKPLAKVHPRQAAEKAGQTAAFGHGRSRQQHGDDAKNRANGCAHPVRCAFPRFPKAPHR